MAQTIRSRIEAGARLLRRHGQEHLMQFATQLSQEEKLQLLEDVNSIDMTLVNELIKRYVHQKPKIDIPKEITPAPVYPAQCPQELQKKYQQAREYGERLIAEHKVAVFTVAGGMGTRLMFDGPKGSLPATCLRNKPLFQVFAEGIIATQRCYNSIVPWYIMTSPSNHDDTIIFFKENEYFGLDPANIVFFRQGMLPSFDKNGKMMLSERYRVATSPDGHGGSLRAVYKSGALADMAGRGVEYISYFQVDNPMVYVADPLFIGLHALDGAEMSSKAVLKCDPLEKVGNFAIADERTMVIEYSDLPDELAHQHGDDDSLMFKWGSIAIHIVSRAFVERINSRGFSLPWHRADKRVPYLDENGNRVNPDQPNAIKLETFVFDALPLAEKSVTLEIERSEQFAPIKNAAGVDSLHSSQQLQIERAARWMEAAGIEVPRKKDGSVGVIIEISSLFALDAAELARKRAQLRPLKPGDIVYLG